jgi:hypothetical protein
MVRQFYIKDMKEFLVNSPQSSSLCHLNTVQEISHGHLKFPAQNFCQTFCFQVTAHCPLRTIAKLVQNCGDNSPRYTYKDVIVTFMFVINSENRFFWR